MNLKRAKDGAAGIGRGGLNGTLGCPAFGKPSTGIGQMEKHFVPNADLLMRRILKGWRRGKLFTDHQVFGGHTALLEIRAQILQLAGMVKMSFSQV